MILTSNFIDNFFDDAFAIKSVNNGRAICMKQSWNKHCQNSTMSIDRLSDIIGNVYG